MFFNVSGRDDFYYFPLPGFASVMLTDQFTPG